MRSLLFAAFLLTALPIAAQTPRPETAPFDTANRKQPYYILLRDGSFIQGRIIRRDSTMFTVRFRGGQLSYVEQTLFDRITDQRPPDNTADELMGRPAVVIQPEPVYGPQIGPQQYTFTLRNGTKIRGELIRKDSTGTVVRTRNLGEVRIPDGQLLKQESAYQLPSTATKTETGATYVITMSDKRQFRGKIIQQDSSRITVRTRDLGDVRLLSNQITRLVKVGSSTPAAGYPNLFPQSLFWGPTAFMPERGKVYYNQQFVLVSQFDVGLTDNWSVSGAFISFFPPLGYSFSTKVAFPVANRLRLGAQAQYLGLGYPLPSDSRVGIGFVQGIATIGSAEQNTTLGAGWTVSNGDVAQNALVTLGFVRKINSGVTFLSQNQVVIGGGRVRSLFLGLVSAGVRFNRKNHAFDLLAYAPIIGYQNQTAFSASIWATYRLRINP